MDHRRERDSDRSSTGDTCPGCSTLRQQLEETQMHARAIAKAADAMRAHEKRQDEMLRTALQENTRLKAFANAVLNGEYDDEADLDEQAREALGF